MLESLIPKELCTRCGLCFALDTKRRLGKDHKGFPLLTSNVPEDYREELLRFCTGRDWNFRALLDSVYGSTQAYDPSTPDIGALLTVGIAYSRDSSLRKMGQSGGISLTLIRAGLRLGLIDACLAVRRPQPGIGDVFGAEPFILKSEEELQQAAGSKYSVAPSLELINEIEKISRIGYMTTLLPCQTAGLRRYGINGGASKCSLIIGPFCGLNMESTMGREVALALKLDPESIIRFGNRAGKFPGITVFEGKDGKEMTLDRTAHRAFYRAFTPERCYTCTDYGNELADIAIADAFLRSKEGDTDIWQYPEGAGYLIVRTPRGHKFLEKVISSGALAFEQIDTATFARRWQRSFEHRKVRAHNRVHQLASEGVPVPRFDYPVPAYAREFATADKIDRFIVKSLRDNPRLRAMFLKIWIFLATHQQIKICALLFKALKHNLFTHVASDVGIRPFLTKVITRRQ